MVSPLVMPCWVGPTSTDTSSIANSWHVNHWGNFGLAVIELSLGCGGASFGYGHVAGGPVGGGHLPNDDPNVRSRRAYRPDHRIVQLVQQCSQLLRRAPLDQRDLDEWHLNSDR